MAPEVNGSGVVLIVGQQSKMKIASDLNNIVEMYTRETGDAATEGTDMDGYTITAPKAAGVELASSS